MSVRQDLANELARLTGYSSATPTPVTLTGPNGIVLTIELTAVDTMGCAVSQILLSVPSLQNTAFDKLKTWAEMLSQRITYLLENIAPLELDPAAGQVLIRSTTPDQLPDGAQYYEILLSSHSSGQFSLRRYKSVKGQPGRDPVDMLVTQQVLLKLADDLVDTVP